MVFIMVLLIWSLTTMGPQRLGETISMSSGWNVGTLLLSVAQLRLSLLFCLTRMIMPGFLGNLVMLFRSNHRFFPLLLSLAVVRGPLSR